MAEPAELDPWKDVIILQNQSWLKAYCLAQTGDPDAAEDLVQDVFLIAYRERDEFERGTNFGGWLRTIARRTCLDFCKRKDRRPLNFTPEALQSMDAAAKRMQGEHLLPDYFDDRRERLAFCLAKLSASLRRMVELRYGKGRSLADIAKTVTRTVAAVGVGLFRARMALSACVRGHAAKRGGAHG